MGWVRTGRARIRERLSYAAGSRGGLVNVEPIPVGEADIPIGLDQGHCANGGTVRILQHDEIANLDSYGRVVKAGGSRSRVGHAGTYGYLVPSRGDRGERAAIQRKTGIRICQSDHVRATPSHHRAECRPGYSGIEALGGKDIVGRRVASAGLVTGEFRGARTVAAGQGNTPKRQTGAGQAQISDHAVDHRARILLHLPPLCDDVTCLTSVAKEASGAGQNKEAKRHRNNHLQQRETTTTTFGD